MDPHTREKTIKLMTHKERDSGSFDVIPLLRSIKNDQTKGREENKEHYKRVANILSEQNNAINRLSTDVAQLSVRTATIELETRKHAITLSQVKERQDGCAARVTHENDTTEIRDLRGQLQKAISRRSSPNGVKAYVEPVKSWWGTAAGKNVLAALAGLLVALTSAVTMWIAMSSGASATERVEPERDQAAHRAPRDYDAPQSVDTESVVGD